MSLFAQAEAARGWLELTDKYGVAMVLSAVGITAVCVFGRALWLRLFCEEKGFVTLLFSDLRAFVNSVRTMNERQAEGHAVTHEKLEALHNDVRELNQRVSPRSTT